jgi:cell shape-determining protein MreC
MLLRFSQVYVFLLALSLLSVFVLPPKYTNPVRSIQGLFAPVARPARAIGWRVRHRLAPPRDDARNALDVRAENERLKAQVVNLTGQLEALQRIDQDRNRLGDIRPYCTPSPVIGSDAGLRDSLAIAATTRDGVRENMPVLYADGVVGVIERVGVAGTQVKLVTDPGFVARARPRRPRLGSGRQAPMRFITITSRRALRLRIGRTRISLSSGAFFCGWIDSTSPTIRPLRLMGQSASSSATRSPTRSLRTLGSCFRSVSASGTLTITIFPLPAPLSRGGVVPSG